MGINVQDFTAVLQYIYQPVDSPPAFAFLQFDRRVVVRFYFVCPVANQRVLVVCLNDPTLSGRSCCGMTKQKKSKLKIMISKSVKIVIQVVHSHFFFKFLFIFFSLFSQLLLQFLTFCEER